MVDYATWYNESSLEDEVDAELARMQEKLTESSASNSALISQLESLNPQLESLEQDLAEARAKQETESKLRRQSELCQDEAEARAREVEDSFKALRMECNEMRQQLAFRTKKGEETRLELEMEKEKHMVEMDEMTHHVKDLTRNSRVSRRKDAESVSPSIISGMSFETRNMTFESRSGVVYDGDDDYVKRLEDQLEDVTEQLIEAETSISNMEGKLVDAEKSNVNLVANVVKMENKVDCLKKNIMTAAESANEKKYTDAKNTLDANANQEELALLTEELMLIKEELKDAEQDTETAKNNLELLQKTSKGELSTLQDELVKVKRDSRSAEFETACLEKALKGANTKMAPLKDEVDNLNEALRTAKRDNEKTAMKMTQIQHAFERQGNDQRVAFEQREEEIKEEHYKEVKTLETEVEKKKIGGDSDSCSSSPIESQADLQTRLDQKEKDLVRITNDLEYTKAVLVNSERRVTELVAEDQQQHSTGGLDPSSNVNVENILNSGDKKNIASEFMALAKVANAQKQHNARLLVKILKLQGNIQVCCRIRPLTNGEIKRGETRVVENLSETEVGCFDSRIKGWKSYAFDKVWGAGASQGSIFQDVEPLVLSAIDGYNACIFAYGQTGSGKTYTMEGAQGDDVGISYRTIEKVFNLLNYRKAQQAAAVIRYEVDNLNLAEPTADASALPSGGDQTSQFMFSIRVGMLEIYNDGVYDLLVKSDPHAIVQQKKSLEIKRDKQGNIHVEGLTKEPVATILDVLKLLKRGNDSRKTAATNLNEHSSRSHMVLSVEVTSGIEGEDPIVGTLFLVDLAGSERVRKSAVVGENLKEATHINKSLSALGNVMESLDKKASHVPYRDSKLTYLLQDSLGGNSRTMMVVTVCPTNITFDETQNALQFATRVRRIHIGSAKKNVKSKNLEETVKNLTSELKMLTKAKERSEDQVTSLRRDHSRIQDRLKSSSDNRANAQDKARTLTVLKQSNAQMTSRWQKEKQLHEKTLADLDAHQNDAKRIQLQLSTATRECTRLGNLVEEREIAQQMLEEELRKVKDASSAADRRARKAQMLQSRPKKGIPRRIKAGVKKPVVKTFRSSTIATASTTEDMNTPRTARPTTAASVATAATEETTLDIDEARGKVLKMLKAHDGKNVGKINAIMARFKGRESFLLVKLAARYNNSENVSPDQVKKSLSGDSSVKSRESSVKSIKSAAQKRSELVLARHREQIRNRKY